MAINTMGDLFTWGNAKNGVLGFKEISSKKSPTQVRSLSKVILISAGPNHSACITSNHLTYTWGLGDNGRLGHGFDDSKYEPLKVDQIENEIIVNVSCGMDYT